MKEGVRVGLDSWIVQDGNYGDFGVGQVCPFALEFFAAHPFRLRHPEAVATPSAMIWLRDSTYAVEGTITFVAERWWVLDAGLPFYTEHTAAPGPVGAPVAGEIYLGIDHFAYFERLASESNAPPLIHDWQIDAIDLDDAPMIEVQPRLLQRDRSRQAWVSLRQTKAWTDSQGWASYVLTCVRLSENPRRRR